MESSSDISDHAARVNSDKESQLEFPPLPRPSKVRVAFFLGLLPEALLANILMALAATSQFTKGDVIPEANRYLSALNVGNYTFHVTLIFAVTAALTFICYLLSIDYRLKKRPRAALLILLGSFLAGLFCFLPVLMGMRGSVEIMAAIGAAGFLFAAVFLFIERQMGRTFERTSTRMLAKDNPTAAAASARSALWFLPGSLIAYRVFGQALLRGAHPEKALPYLAYVSDSETVVTIDSALALASAYERQGDKQRAALHLARAYEMARETQPDNPETAALLKRLLNKYVHLNQAAEFLELYYRLTPDEMDPWRTQAFKYLIHQRDRKALLKECSALESHNPESGPTIRQCYEDVRQLFPEDPTTLKRLAEIYRAAQRTDEEIPLLESLLLLDPADTEVRRRLIALASRQNQGVEMMQHLNQLLFAGEATFDEKILIVRQHLEEGDFARVEEMVGEYPELNTSAKAHAIVAESYLEGGRLQDAIDKAQYARSLGPDKETAVVIDTLESLSKRRVGLLELDSLRDKVAHNPEDLDLRFRFYDHLVPVHGADRVVVELENLLEKDPSLRERVIHEMNGLMRRHGKNARMMDYLGDLHLRERDFDEAFNVYKKRTEGELHSRDLLHDSVQRILSLHSGHIPSLRSEVEYFAHEKRPSDVLKYLDRYQAAGGNSDEALLELEFFASLAMEDYDRAETSGARLLEMRPNDLELLEKLAAMSLAAKNYDVAITRYEKAVEMNPESFEYLRDLKQARTTKSRNRISEIKSLLTAGDDSRLLEEMGDLYHDFQEFSDAISSYQRSSQADPEALVAKAKLGYILALKELFSDSDDVLSQIQLTPDMEPGKLKALKSLFFNTADLMEKELEYNRAGDLYRKIFRVDASYRDVIDRIERLQRGEKLRRRY